MCCRKPELENDADPTSILGLSECFLQISSQKDVYQVKQEGPEGPGSLT